jgi:hypothetical protein
MRGASKVQAAKALFFQARNAALAAAMKNMFTEGVSTYC